MKEMKIVEWTEKSWNPVTGCDKVSSGCANCYAKEATEGYLKRWKNPRYINGFNLTLHEDLQVSPMKWKKPRQVFPCSIFLHGRGSEFIHSNSHKLIFTVCVIEYLSNSNLSSWSHVIRRLSA